MKTRAWPLLFLLLTLPGVCRAGEETPSSNTFVIDEFLLQSLPGGYGVANFIEMVAASAVSLIEESNGFAAFDQPRVFYEGLSATQTQWTYDGFRVNSALNDGAPAFSLPRLAQSAMALQGQSPWDGGAHVAVSTDPSFTGLRLSLSGAIPRVGGTTGLGWLLVPNLAAERGQIFATNRRRLDHDATADILWRRVLNKKTSLLLAAGWREQGRLFNTLQTEDGTFTEGGSSVQLYGRLQRQLSRSRLTVSAAFDHLQRDNLYAELGRVPEETLGQTRDAGFLGLAVEGSRSTARLSLQVENETRRSDAGNWNKELQDRDGEGFWPFERQGDFSSATLRMQAERRIPFGFGRRTAEIKPFVDLNWTQVKGNETVPDFNTVTFDNDAYQVILWQDGTAYRHRRLDMNGGLAVRLPLTRRLDLQGRGFARGQSLTFESGAANLTVWTPGFDVGLEWRPSHRWNLMLAFGRIPLELGPQVSFFLESGRPSGQIWHWRDSDGDLAYDSGETNYLFGYSGGGHHTAAENLRCPVQQRLMALIGLDLGKRFRLDIKGILGKTIDQLWVRFAEEYGYYTTVNGQSVYVISKAYDRYVLTNNDFLRNPFYSELLLRLSARRENRWFFSLSFLSHIGMGATAFGNGVESDSGVIDESQANPNTWYNAFGRVNGDRAFVGKIYFGWRLNSRLFVASTIRYRDGQSFSFLDAYYRRMTWILLYNTIKGEDEHGVKGGPREDCVWDINAQVTWRLPLLKNRVSLWAAVYNIFDFGSELSENVFSGGSRLPNELQLPRSLRLGVTADF
jgi:hypothetical protein